MLKAGQCRAEALLPVIAALLAAIQGSVSGAAAEDLPLSVIAALVAAIHVFVTGAIAVQFTTASLRGGEADEALLATPLRGSR